MNKFIPVCEPTLKGNEDKYIKDAIDTNWISSAGKYIPLFEEGFSNYCNVEYGIATTNGTTALHLALVALGIGKGDEVILPNFTMIASAFSVVYTGAKPVFVDAEPDTWNIDVNQIESKISEKTKAIMVVHIFGHPVNMGKIWEIAKKYNLKIIEDAAEAHGAEYKGKKVGSLGDIAAFSFFANKIATTGEGGMVVTNDKDLADKCRYYKNLCFPLGSERIYVHEDVGFNYRMSNLHAAIGLAQTEKIEDYITARIKNHALYEKYLGDIEGITLQSQMNYAKNVCWMNGVLIDTEKIRLSRDEIINKLKDYGIDARRFFIGMNKQPSLIKYGCDISGEFPITDELSENGLYLPSSSSLNEGKIKYICEKLKDIINA